LRPRDIDHSYYFIYYKPEKDKVGTIIQEQPIFGEYLDLAPGEKLTQEIKLWQASKHLSQINIWAREKDNIKDSIELLLLSENKRSIAGRGEYLSHADKEAIFRFLPIINHGKNEKMLLQVSNKGSVPIGIGYYYGDLYNEGNLFRNDKKLVGDMSIRLIYKPNNLRLYKRFNQDAFILTEQGE